MILNHILLKFLFLNKILINTWQNTCHNYNIQSRFYIYKNAARYWRNFRWKFPWFPTGKTFFDRISDGFFRQKTPVGYSVPTGCDHRKFRRTVFWVAHGFFFWTEFLTITDHWETHQNRIFEDNMNLN